MLEDDDVEYEIDDGSEITDKEEAEIDDLKREWRPSLSNMQKLNITI